jgi:hypothetical protein
MNHVLSEEVDSTMATPARGLARERHTRIKAVAAALATGGFVLAWLGFTTSHASEPGAAEGNGASLESALVLAPTPTATGTAVAPPTGNSAEPTFTPAAQPTATTSPPSEPTATAAPVPQSRTSRGS